MRISYIGQMKECKHNTRIAEVCYSEKEERIAERMMDLMDKTAPWWKPSGFDGMFIVPVADREEYEEFAEWYMNAKRMFKNCEKFGF